MILRNQLLDHLNRLSINPQALHPAPKVLVKEPEEETHACKCQAALHLGELRLCLLHVE